MQINRRNIGLSDWKCGSFELWKLQIGEALNYGSLRILIEGNLQSILLYSFWTVSGDFLVKILTSLSNESARFSKTWSLSKAPFLVRKREEDFETQRAKTEQKMQQKREYDEPPSGSINPIKRPNTRPFHMSFIFK